METNVKSLHLEDSETHRETSQTKSRGQTIQRERKPGHRQQACNPFKRARHRPVDVTWSAVLINIWQVVTVSGVDRQWDPKRATGSISALGGTHPDPGPWMTM